MLRRSSCFLLQLSLLLTACGSDPAAPAELPFAPQLPAGVALQYGGERPAFPRLATACDSTALDRARAESLAREPILTDWTAAERATFARDIASRVYGVQDQNYFWLVRADGPNRERYRRGRLNLGLRAGVTPDMLWPTLQSLGATQLRVSSSATLPLGVDVAPGSERPALLALLSDCRLRYVTLEAELLAERTSHLAHGG